jgi:hypothetical protein
MVSNVIVYVGISGIESVYCVVKYKGLYEIISVHI